MLGSFRLSLTMISVLLVFNMNLAYSVDSTAVTSNQMVMELLDVEVDSFPRIGFDFEVESHQGVALWELKESNLSVKEGGRAVLIDEFHRKTDFEHLKLSLVIDHSGSMSRDMSILLDANSYNKNGSFALEGVYQTPLERTKTAAGSFLSHFDWKKDSAQIIGFGTQVDTIQPFSNNEVEIYQRVARLKPYGFTAYYDAVYQALEEMRGLSGPRYIIAMTDGLDNRSKRNPKEVIELAVEIGVPIYTIALGEAGETWPKRIGWNTSGDFYYAHTALDLKDIYRTIARRILSRYHLSFFSRDRQSTNVSRTVQLELDLDTIRLSNASFTYEISADVIALLAEEERQRKFRTWLMYGAGGAVLVIIFLILLIRKRRKKQVRVEKSGSTSEQEEDKKVEGSKAVAAPEKKVEEKVAEAPKAVQYQLEVTPKNIVDKVKISYETGGNEKLKLDVTNENGKVLFQKDLKQEKGAFVINFEKTSSKTFVVRLKDGARVLLEQQAKKV